MYPIISINKGREDSVHYRHPWIFSGALVTPIEAEHGAMVTVSGSKGETLGVGTFSSHSSIAIRMFEFGKAAVIDRAWFSRKFTEANERRRLMGYGSGTQTTGYRVIFGECDGVPGLVLDKYEDVIVFQISTAGLEKLRDEVVAAAVEVFAPRAVVERSDIPVRREEGLSEASGVRYGEDPGLVEFSENGLRFFADVLQGQKTGFFLDQKDLRKTIASLAKDRTILNLFSYSGAASVAALKSGAKSARNVDSSDAAIALIAKQTELNGIDASAVTSEPLDIFQFFNQKSDATYDMVIMDPPALIKSQRDAEEGKKAYHFLNRAALRMVADKGIFVTSSCSRYLTEDDFAFMLRRAAQQAGVTLSVLRMERQSADHPTSVYFPESAYLKSYVCEVRRHAPDGAGHRQAA